MYILRNIGCDLSVDILSKCFDDASALFKHEVAYCIGQTGNKKAVPLLCSILENRKQGCFITLQWFMSSIYMRYVFMVEDLENIVRHEAGEALGAIGDPAALPTLRKYLDDSIKAVSQTCELAIARINWAAEKRNKGEDCFGRSPYDSVGKF